MSVPAPRAAGTPTPRMSEEDGWRYNEDADIKLLCLRIFALTSRSQLLHQPVPAVQLGDLLPFLRDAKYGVEGGAVAQLQVDLAGQHAVRAEVAEGALAADTLANLLVARPLPFAVINQDKASYADSVLLLRLTQPAPTCCSPATVAIGTRVQRTFTADPGGAPAEQAPQGPRLGVGGELLEGVQKMHRHSDPVPLCPHLRRSESHLSDEHHVPLQRQRLLCWRSE